MNIQTPPVITRHRHDLQRRLLTVARVEEISPQMRRIVLTGPELAGFVSLAPHDHVKLILPAAAGAEPERRDYTPRWFDAEALELAIDFAMHDAGPATDWARGARPGDPITIGGPRGSQVIEGVRRWLLIGDETALPAIGRRTEEAAPGTGIAALIAVASADDHQVLATPARLDIRWVHRPISAAADPAPLLDALGEEAIAPGTFVWIAAEAGVVRALRDHLLQERGHPRDWLKASGYWVAGRADATENFD